MKPRTGPAEKPVTALGVKPLTGFGVNPETTFEVATTGTLGATITGAMGRPVVWAPALMEANRAAAKIKLDFIKLPTGKNVDLGIFIVNELNFQRAARTMQFACE